MIKFKIGDKLKALEFHQDEYGLKFVTIYKINEENQVYHWEAPNPTLGGIIRSGYFFTESELYEE
jgi:hypothetical protein